MYDYGPEQVWKHFKKSIGKEKDYTCYLRVEYKQTNSCEQRRPSLSDKGPLKTRGRFPSWVSGSQVLRRPPSLDRHQQTPVKATHLCWEEKQRAFPVACIIFPALVLSWKPWDRRNFPSSFSSWDKTDGEKTKRSHEQWTSLLQRKGKRQITRSSLF